MTISPRRKTAIAPNPDRAKEAEGLGAIAIQLVLRMSNYLSSHIRG